MKGWQAAVLAALGAFGIIMSATSIGAHRYVYGVILAVTSCLSLAVAIVYHQRKQP